MYHLNITEAFKKYTKKHSLQKNVNQEDLIKTLDTLTEQLKPSFLKSVTSIFQSKKPKGFYLYGDVGAGKTMIVNFFLEYLNHPRVLKTHFNKFMVDIHNKLHKLKNESNPLPKIVKTFKKDFDIIFFDPPFLNTDIYPLLSEIKDHLTPNGFVYLEVNKKYSNDEFNILKYSKVGKVYFYLLQ